MDGTPAVEQIALKSHPDACNSYQEKQGATRIEKIRTGLDVNLTLHICYDVD